MSIDQVDRANQAQQIQYYPEDGIDLRELIWALWKGKWIVLLFTALFAMGGVMYALSLPNIYRAQALLSPADESQGGGLSAMAGQLGGLASLAGVSLPKGKADKAALAIEVMKSRDFITDFIRRRELLVPLLAPKEWNRETGQLVIDAELYDSHKGVWVREVKPPRTAEPSDWDAYKAFSSQLSVSESKETGFITVAFDHLSPNIAAQWISWLVKDINQRMKESDIKEAQTSIDYLQQELNKTSVTDMQQVFYQLIEKQIQNMMLANVRSEYVFKTLDPAVTPQERQSPNRALICVLATILGGMFGVFVVLVGFTLTSRKPADSI